VHAGDIFVIGERTGPPGFSVIGGEESVFYDVTVHACANECFTSLHTNKLAILGGGTCSSFLITSPVEASVDRA
jgi:hypothetical protein